ncbi:MAG: hypothetical protein ABJD24_04655 [Acidimicrobiales bacterium]
MSSKHSTGQTATGPASPTARHLATYLGGPLLVWSGPFTRATRPERVLSAYHLLVTWRDPSIELVMHGPAVEPDVVSHVDRFAHELVLTKAWIAPNPDQEMIDAFSTFATLVVTPDDLPDAGVADLADALWSVLRT